MVGVSLSVRSFPVYYRRGVAALVVDNGIMAGFAGYDAPRAVFPSTAAGARQCLHFTLYSLLLSAGPRFSAS